MKIICPHCGVKGTATEELLEKKVRCPECNKVFRVIEEFFVPADVVAEQSDVGTEAIVEEPAPAEEVIKEDVNLPEGVELCSRCGFAFSEQFSEVVGTENFCSLCASRRPIAE